MSGKNGKIQAPVIPQHLLEATAKEVSTKAIEYVKDIAFRTTAHARHIADMVESTTLAPMTKIAAYRALQSDRMAIVELVAKYGGKNPFLAILEDELRNSAKDIVHNFTAYCEAGMPSKGELEAYRAWVASQASEPASSPSESAE